MTSLSLRCPNCKHSFLAQNQPGNLSAMCPRCNRVMRWFYAHNNQRYGPLLFGQLSQLAQGGTILSTDWVFQEGTQGWVAARDVPDLFTAQTATAPAVALDNTTLTGVKSPIARGHVFPSESAPGTAPAGSKRLHSPPARSRRKLYAVLGGLAVAATAAGLIAILIINNQGGGDPEPPPPNNPGQPAAKNPDPKDKMSGQEVYKKTLPSTVWIVTRKGSGTGSLVDATQRLVITNAHVVPKLPNSGTGVLEEDDQFPLAYFPMFKDGKLLAERDYYNLQRYPGGPIKGKVVYRDELRDLAIVQLAKLLPDAVPIKLATDSAFPGEKVHAIGNPGASSALWVYAHGEVGQVSHKTWNSGPQGGPLVQLSAQVLETRMPANPGDSGGPVVNMSAELVGVTQGYSAGANLLSYAIDVSEVHYVLSTYKKTNMASSPK